MAKPGGKNKAEDELEREYKENLMVEIDLLKTKIYTATRDEVEANAELTRLHKKIEEEEKQIEEFSNEQGKMIKKSTVLQDDSLSQNQKEIRELEDIIKEKDNEIQKLLDEMEDKDKVNKQLIEGLDMNISDNRNQFEQMSIRFENILQKTAAKLQEKTEVGK